MNRILVVVIAGLALCVSLFASTVEAIVDLSTIGKVEERDLGPESRDMIVLSGFLAKDIYFGKFGIYVDPNTSLEIESGTEIQFNSGSNIAAKSFFIAGEVKLNNVTLKAVNITDDAAPEWNGITVLETGRLEAGGLRIENQAENFPWTVKSLGGNVSIEKSNLIGIYIDGGSLSLNQVNISDLKIFEGAKVAVMNSYIRLGKNGSTQGVHAWVSTFTGHADFSGANIWEGGEPLFKVYKDDEGIDGAVFSNPQELAHFGIITETPTSVGWETWGSIKKLFSKK